MYESVPNDFRYPNIDMWPWNYMERQVSWRSLVDVIITRHSAPAHEQLRLTYPDEKRYLLRSAPAVQLEPLH